MITARWIYPCGCRMRASCSLLSDLLGSDRLFTCILHAYWSKSSATGRGLPLRTEVKRHWERVIPPARVRAHINNDFNLSLVQTELKMFISACHTLSQQQRTPCTFHCCVRFAALPPQLRNSETSNLVWLCRTRVQCTQKVSSPFHSCKFSAFQQVTSLHSCPLVMQILEVTKCKCCRCT